MIVFFVRRYNDIDHITPIIYKFALEGVNCSIYCLNPSFDIYSDYRLEFLRSEYNIEIKYLHSANNYSVVNKIVSNYYCGPNKRLKNERKVSFIFRRLIQKFLHKNFVSKRLNIYIYNDKWISNFLKKVNPKVLVFDHIKREQFLSGQIIKIAKMKKIPCIAVPHGLPLFVDEFFTLKQVKTKTSMDYGSKFSHFDYFIVQNELLKCNMIKNGLSKDKIKVLGSTRFCAEWNTIHSKFKGTHKMLQSSLNDKRLKVVFMDTLPMYLVDVKLVEETIKCIGAINGISLMVKPHTRSNKMSTEKMNNSICFATEISSIDLCNWADVIIATSSSILVEAFIQDKVFLYPKYLHKNTMLFEKYNACLTTNTVEETKLVLEKMLLKNIVRGYSEDNVNKFLIDAIYGGIKGRDVLKNYVEFINSKALN